MFARHVAKAAQTTVYNRSQRTISNSIAANRPIPRNYYKYDVNDAGASEINELHARGIQYFSPLFVVCAVVYARENSTTFNVPSDYSVWKKLDADFKAAEKATQKAAQSP